MKPSSQIFPSPKLQTALRVAALGEGFQPVSGGCVRIKGYIAVGSQFRFVGAPAGGIFAARPINAPPVAGSGGLGGLRFESLGGARLYVQDGLDARHD